MQEVLAESLGVIQKVISKRLKAMGMIQKWRNWVPYELKPRVIKRHFFACEQLLQRQNRKGCLHRIVSGDETCVHHDNHKRRKLWGMPGHVSMSTARPNIHGAKVMLCIWWDQLGVVMRFQNWVKPSQGIGIERSWCVWPKHWRKNGHSTKRHDKVILLHNNSWPRVAKPVKT